MLQQKTVFSVRFSAASFPDRDWTARRGRRAGDLKYGHVDAKNIGHTYDLYGISPTRTQVTAYASVDVRVRYRDNDKIINCGPLPRWPHNPPAENRIEFLFVQNRTYARARRPRQEYDPGNVAWIHRWLLNGYGETFVIYARKRVLYRVSRRKTRRDTVGIVRFGAGTSRNVAKLVVQKCYRLANLTMKLQRLIIYFVTFNNIV